MLIGGRLFLAAALLSRRILMFDRLRYLLTRFHKDDTGAMSVEAILIVALISIPILILLYLFKGVIVGWFTKQQSDLQNDVGNG
jgi:Flp pilus assembly pilin Flp